MFGQSNFLPQAGDWVRVYLPRLGVWHHGIVQEVAVFWNGTFQAIVAHNAKGVGVTTSYWNDFAEGQTVYLHQRAVSEVHVQAILERIHRNHGKPYFLFAQNCEHYASLVFTGKAESPTVKQWGALAVFGLLLALLFGSE